MILIAASRAILQAYHITPAHTTPAIPSGDWYRMWRVDARKIGRKEITFFTNSETLYTLVVDSTRIKTLPELAAAFMTKYSAVFIEHFGTRGRIEKQIVIHKALDRGLVSVMNSFFLNAEYSKHLNDPERLQLWINEIPVVSRNLFPSDSLRERLVTMSNPYRNPA